ncbi:MAG TPA: hypothetical protein ENF81_08950 [Thermotogaceae bacterium]|nr:hypothetical protein [Thermotogaceae bacterium]
MELAKKFRVSRHRVYEAIYNLETLKGIEIKRKGRKIQLTDDLIKQIEQYFNRGKGRFEHEATSTKKEQVPSPLQQLKSQH